jgi:methionyl aminopeptidase
VPGPLRAIGRAVSRAVDDAGFTVLRPLSGHGIGRTIHEPPDVLNYDEPRNTAA